MTDEQLAARGLDRWGFPIVRAITFKPTPPEPRRVPRRQRGVGSFSEDKLIPGLRRMCETQQEGQRFGREHIARECGVDKETIRQIEKTALKKIRARMGQAFFRQLADTVGKTEHVVNRYLPAA